MNVRGCLDLFFPPPIAAERHPPPLAARVGMAIDAARRRVDGMRGDFRMSEPASMLCTVAAGTVMLGLSFSLLYAASQRSPGDDSAEAPALNASGTLLTVGFVLLLLAGVVCCATGIATAVHRWAPQAPDDPAPNA